MTKNKILITNRKGRKVFYRFSDKGIKTRSVVMTSFNYDNWNLWNNKWIGVLFSVPNTINRERHSIRKVLKKLKFASLYPGFWTRPNNHSGLLKSLKGVAENALCKVIEYEYHSSIKNDEIKEIFELDKLNAAFKDELKVIAQLLAEDNQDEIYNWVSLESTSMHYVNHLTQYLLFYFT